MRGAAIQIAKTTFHYIDEKPSAGKRQSNWSRASKSCHFQALFSTPGRAQGLTGGAQKHLQPTTSEGQSASHVQQPLGPRGQSRHEISEAPLSQQVSQQTLSRKSLWFTDSRLDPQTKKNWGSVQLSFKSAPHITQHQSCLSWLAARGPGFRGRLLGSWRYELVVGDLNLSGFADELEG